jgi:hypothetical protein
MTVLPRGSRTRRGGRRPAWVLMTVLLVLAIGASSALVFTNRVELLKLAVILALWAAVVAAFVSVIYRRQSESDQAKARDLKYVYDLQLDREISARREYELNVEAQLRRELAAELRAQSADEVAALRAELAALRTNLEILFDTDLAHRPAIEHDRTTVRAYRDWAPDAETTGRVSSSRLDEMLRADEVDDTDVRTEESPIIDVPAEPQPPEPERVPPAGAGGVHRLGADEAPAPQERNGRRRRAEEPRGPAPVWPPPAGPMPQPPPQPQPRPEPVAEQQQPPSPWRPPQPPPEPPAQPQPAPAPAPAPEPLPAPVPPSGRRPAPGEAWVPAPAEGQWLPPGAPGSNWVSPPAETPAEYVGRRRAPEETSPEPPRGRHYASPEEADAADVTAAPAPAGEAPPEGEPARHHPAEPEQTETAEEARARRHRSVEDTGGQSVADLLARLQAGPTTGGGRRRREE